ncbi:MAG: hypothetical protein RIB84_22410 [Sneathiellaceae bacterium]
MSSVIWESRYRIGQAVTWLAGEERRSGEIGSYVVERDGSYTLYVRAGGATLTVIEAQVVQAAQDGAPAPPQAVGAVDGAEARALAQAVLDGVSIRRPVQQQLRMLAMAVLGKPFAPGEVRS